MSHRHLFALVPWALAFVVGTAPGCSGKTLPAIMVAITTDMDPPKDFDAVGTGAQALDQPNQPVFHSTVTKISTVTGQKIRLPTTLSVVGKSDGSRPRVKLRVVAFAHGHVRILRDAIT